MDKISKPTQKARKPAAKRVAAANSRAKSAAAPERSAAKKVAARKPAPKRVAARKAPLRRGVEDGYVVYESSIEPKHFTVEQIRRAVKAVVNG